MCLWRRGRRRSPRCTGHASPHRARHPSSSAEPPEEARRIFLDFERFDLLRSWPTSWLAAGASLSAAAPWMGDDHPRRLAAAFGLAPGVASAKEARYVSKGGTLAAAWSAHCMVRWSRRLAEVSSLPLSSPTGLTGVMERTFLNLVILLYDGLKIV